MANLSSGGSAIDIASGPTGRSRLHATLAAVQAGAPRRHDLGLAWP